MADGSGAVVNYTDRISDDVSEAVARQRDEAVGRKPDMSPESRQQSKAPSTGGYLRALGNAKCARASPLSAPHRVHSACG